jgi:hypothetical protein
VEVSPIPNERPNRAILREVDDLIRETNVAFEVDAVSYDVLCECGTGKCAERIKVPGTVYELVRADHGHFLVAPGHELPEEQVVSTEGTYRVVTPA